MPAQNKSNEIRITRIYDAPVRAVWDAWTDPAQAAQWWGPRGFTLTTHSKDLRPGGSWVYTMHGPDDPGLDGIVRQAGGVFSATSESFASLSWCRGTCV
jgi:uncharacterized protein YndB with AHSA1/START domain